MGAASWLDQGPAQTRWVRVLEPMEPSVIVASLALVVSVFTAWATLVRRGHVNMTQPTMVYFGPDGSVGTVEGKPKVFLRCLLYSTGKRGRVAESMYARLRRGETSQAFNIWVHGDERLTRGSGLFVGQEGVATNHHFLLPEDGTAFEFLPGEYQLDVWAVFVNTTSPRHLCHLRLSVTQVHAEELRESGAGLYFDWGAEAKRYHGHVQKKPQRPPGIRLADRYPGMRLSDRVNP